MPHRGNLVKRRHSTSLPQAKHFANWIGEGESTDSISFPQYFKCWGNRAVDGPAHPRVSQLDQLSHQQIQQYSLGELEGGRIHPHRRKFPREYDPTLATELAYKLRPLRGYDLKVSYTRNYSFFEKGFEGVLKKVRRCQVIYSRFGLAIHQNDHQVRRRFVEWAQNEIAVVPDFHKQNLFSDEAHFWLNGYVNKQNCRIWSEANPQMYVETPLHAEKLTVWCALWAGGILLQKR
ncbi:hypothetical protein TNCV_1316531 [Trichonephila clavipes]|nr:hypothetical protein TNCV_1316531 [Trichonephila clavipes]